MSAKVYGICTYHSGRSAYGVIGGVRPDDEDVEGMVIDESGHAIYSHYSSSMKYLCSDLARGASEKAPEAEFVWCGDDRTDVPAPCPGCDECAESRARAVRDTP